MFKIGNIEVKGKVILAPMAGITSVGYRDFMIPFGASLAYTEMISDMGLIYGNKETFTYLPSTPSAVPLGIQLFGSDPINLGKAARICEEHTQYFDFFDVNMACPVPKVTKTGAGSALMQNPKLCGDIIREIKKNTNKPVTAKIRLSYDMTNINFKEVIKELENAGCDAVAIHPRTRSELYSGLPHYDLVKDLRKEMKIPLFISGNIYTLKDAIKALEITKADAVMVARGGMGNPFLVKQLNQYFEKGEVLETPSFLEQCDYCLELGKSMSDDFGEEKAMRIYRGIAPRFFAGFPNSRTLRVTLATSLTDYKSLVKLIDDFKQDFIKM